MFLICRFFYGTVLIALSLSLSLFLFVLQKILDYFPFVQIVFQIFLTKVNQIQVRFFGNNYSRWLMSFLWCKLGEFFLPSRSQNPLLSIVTQ